MEKDTPTDTADPLVLLRLKLIGKAKDVYNDKKWTEDTRSEHSFDADLNSSWMPELLADELNNSLTGKRLTSQTLKKSLQNGIGKNTKSTTLTSIAKYVGYDSFEAFCLDNKQHIDAAKEAITERDKEFFYPSLRGFIDLKIKRKLAYALSAILVIYIGFKIWQKANTPNDDELFSAVEKADETEITLYKKLPSVDMDRIRAVMTGGRLAEIESVVQRRQKDGLIMSNVGNKSVAEIYDEYVADKSATKATVKTIEHWVLHWFDPRTGTYPKPAYEQITTQTYILVKEDGQWRVEWNSRRLLETQNPKYRFR